MNVDIRNTGATNINSGASIRMHRLTNPNGLELGSEVAVELDHGRSMRFRAFVARVVLFRVIKAHVRVGPVFDGSVGNMQCLAYVGTVQVLGHGNVFLVRNGSEKGVIIDINVIPALRKST